MKRTVSGLSFILALLFSAVAGIQFVKVATANPIVYLPYIVIRSDGSVEPETEFVKQDGNVYSLTANLSQQYAIVIQCSNIVFDGGGHAINGSVPSGGPGYSNIGISLEHVTNVTVKNVKVSGFSNRDIALQGCSNCSILRVKAETFALGYRGFDSYFNTIAESNIGDLGIWFSSNNVIIRNNITDVFDIRGGNSNTFFENNFMCESTRYYFGGGIVNFWDNGSIGNYWRDYTGKDANGDGIGDTPYIIDAKNQDNYPLMNPFVIPEFPDDEKPTKPTTEPLPITWIVTAIVIIAIGGVGFLIYFRKIKKTTGKAE